MKNIARWFNTLLMLVSNTGRIAFFETLIEVTPDFNAVIPAKRIAAANEVLNTNIRFEDLPELCTLDKDMYYMPNEFKATIEIIINTLKEQQQLIELSKERRYWL